MAPLGTKLIMNAVGLGKAHKEIEERKRRASELEVRERMASRGAKSGPSLRSTDIPTPYPKVHRDHLSRETLAEYGLAWHWDHNDKAYIIIEKHLTSREMNELLEHTRWLRKPKDSKSGVHIHLHQTQNNHPPALEKASIVPSSPNALSSSPRNPTIQGMNSRPAHPFSHHDYTSMEQPHQYQGRNDGTRSRSRMSHGPAEVPFTSSRPAQETMLRSPTARPGSRPYEGAPSTSASSRQRRHTMAPLDHIGFASPSTSGSLAQGQRLEQAAMNARRSSTQYARGFGQPQRERSLYSAREPELQRAYSHAPGPMSMGADGTRRHRGGRQQFRDM